MLQRWVFSVYTESEHSALVWNRGPWLFVFVHVCMRALPVVWLSGGGLGLGRCRLLLRHVRGHGVVTTHCHKQTNAFCQALLLT